MAAAVIIWGVLAAPESVRFLAVVACRTERDLRRAFCLRVDVGVWRLLP